MSAGPRRRGGGAAARGGGEEGPRVRGRFLTAWNSVRYGWTLRPRPHFNKLSPLYLLGRVYCPATQEELGRFRGDFGSRLWLTYRRGFPALEGTRWSTDCGWGCMLRSAQMLLAQGLVLHLLGRGNPPLPHPPQTPGEAPKTHPMSVCVCVCVPTSAPSLGSRLDVARGAVGAGADDGRGGSEGEGPTGKETGPPGMSPGSLGMDAGSSGTNAGSLGHLRTDTGTPRTRLGSPGMSSRSLRTTPRSAGTDVGPLGTPLGSPEMSPGPPRTPPGPPRTDPGSPRMDPGLPGTDTGIPWKAAGPPETISRPLGTSPGPSGTAPDPPGMSPPGHGAVSPGHRGLVRRRPPGPLRHPSPGGAGAQRREKSRGLVRTLHRRPHPAEGGGILPGDPRPLRLRLPGLHRLQRGRGGAGAGRRRGPPGRAAPRRRAPGAGAAGGGEPQPRLRGLRQGAAEAGILRGHHRGPTPALPLLRRLPRRFLALPGPPLLPARRGHLPGELPPPVLPLRLPPENGLREDGSQLHHRILRRGGSRAAGALRRPGPGAGSPLGTGAIPHLHAGRGAGAGSGGAPTAPPPAAAAPPPKKTHPHQKRRRRRIRLPLTPPPNTLDRPHRGLGGGLWDPPLPPPQGLGSFWFTTGTGDPPPGPPLPAVEEGGVSMSHAAHGGGGDTHVIYCSTLRTPPLVRLCFPPPQIKDELESEPGGVTVFLAPPPPD